MVKIQIIQVGKTKSAELEAMILDYFKMLKSTASVTQIVLKEASKGNKSEIKLQEAQEIIKHIPEKSFLIALSEDGKQFDSINFAKFLEKTFQTHSSLTFVIGGPFGLDESIKNRAHLLLSFSKFTFTHQMIRLLLAEQLFRAFTIINNKIYHY